MKRSHRDQLEIANFDPYLSFILQNPPCIRTNTIECLYAVFDRLYLWAPRP